MEIDLGAGARSATRCWPRDRGHRCLGIRSGQWGLVETTKDASGGRTYLERQGGGAGVLGDTGWHGHAMVGREVVAHGQSRQQGRRGSVACTHHAGIKAAPGGLPKGAERVVTSAPFAGGRACTTVSLLGMGCACARRLQVLCCWWSLVRCSGATLRRCLGPRVA